MVPFDELIRFRSELREFTRDHEASVQTFYNSGAGWFELSRSDGEFPDPGERPVRHLTTTVTCLESLYERPESAPELSKLPPFVCGHGECDEPDATAPEGAAAGVGGGAGTGSAEATGEVPSRRAQLLRFAEVAAANPERWKSDDAAYTYCRVRTLGAMLRLLTAGDVDELRAGEAFRSLAAEAWASRENTGWFGLRETTTDPHNTAAAAAGEDALARLKGPPTEETYPPNAFLTYWGLLALDGLPDQWRLDGTEDLKEAALGWLDRSLAMQVAFRYNRSAHADPQQLAWSICALVRFGDEAALAAHTTTAYAQLTAGLRAFFAQQNARTGQWDKGQPLFHYPNAGNAYCYTFETLAELTSLATRADPSAEALRDALLPYLPKLMAAFSSARETRQQIVGGWGWSSGHHPHRVKPEAWATASVFRFAEALRRLVGYWSNAEAQKLLGARKLTSESSPQQVLRERGGTWDAGWGSAGTQLSTGFLHHIARAEAVRLAQANFIPDPDEQVIPAHGGRSAMLFGPPGTGKTTLVRLIAECLEWPFVEIVPAQFLDQGVDLASKRADEIFRQVMELDRCVVLLDEIDELIQARTRDAEPTERFFTTTMLPRLARLWEHRKILFFVNTNNVFRVDAAIRRGQRFDYGIFVLPPGVAVKQAAIDKARPADKIDDDEIRKQLEKIKDEPARSADPITWLPLVRHDQLWKLTELVSKQPTPAGGKSTKETVEKALASLINELKSLDWAPEPGDNPEDTSKDVMPKQVSQMLRAQRREPEVRMVVEVAEAAKEKAGIDPQERYATLPVGIDSPDLWAAREGFTLTPDGVLGVP